MCLALPGKIISIDKTGELCMGEVDFAGVRKTICLEYTPESQVGDYVLVHVGFSISVLKESDAKATLEWLAKAVL